jgi:hypothetical protein
MLGSATGRQWSRWVLNSAHGYPTLAQLDSPAGILGLSCHESRVYSIWENGRENFYFKATPDEINELIRLFSESRMRDHELCLRVGTPSVRSFKDNKISYNVNLHVLGGIALAYYRGGNEGPETCEPTLTVYVDPVADVFLKQMTLPDNIILTNLVVDSLIKGKATRPNRKVWHAQVQFEDSTPAADFQHLFSTEVTLWKKDAKRGINLGRVSHKGYFSAGFSEKEIANLNTGESWLTLTAGNSRTEAKKDHPRLSVKNFVLDKQKVQPVKIGKPKFYHGRILFEDGFPPILDPVTWGRAEIGVHFPYIGIVPIDSGGYFRVYFTKAQYERIKAAKVRENIFFPSYEEKGMSTTRFVFPPSKLSLEKTKAGVVKIPKPGPKKDDSK